MEQVFVVRRADFFAGDWPQGFAALTPDDGRRLVAAFSEQGFFARRVTAEENPAWKQPIPYCVVTRGDQVFQVRRRRAGGEQRLHGLISVGIGGHIGPEDRGPAGSNLMERGLLRELHEELVLPDLPADAHRLIGMLNDDSNPVGRVHVGLVYRLELPARSAATDAEIRIREISKLEGGFAPLVEIHDLCEDADRVEGWSRIVIEALFRPPHLGDTQTATQSE